MKALIPITTLIGFLLASPIHSFSQSAETESPTLSPTTSVIPEYQIEEMGAPGDAEEPLLPFVHNGYVYAFSVAGKRPVWRIFIGGDLVNPFTVDKGRLFVYDIYNRMLGIDAVKRKILWKTDIKDEIRGRPCVYKHYVLVSTQKGSLVILSDESGQILFEHPGAAGVVGGLTVFRNLAVVPYKNGRIAAFDVDTKTEAWAFNAGGAVGVSPVVSGGFVYVGAWNETFYAIDASTGKLRWASYVGEDVSREFLVFDDVVVLFFSKGQVLGLDQESGEIRWARNFERLEFNFNYFQAKRKFFLFTPEFTALNPSTGEVLYRYRERAYSAFKEMLFENMIAGEHALTEEEKNVIMSTAYFTVKSYPHMPPLTAGGTLVYFVTEDSYFYVYDLERDFFMLKYKLTQG
jgi:outer membrane protein assembly factor BamB